MATKPKAEAPAVETNGGAPTTTGAKVNVFAKAKGKAAATPTKPGKKETVWTIGAPAVTEAASIEELNKSVTEMHRIAKDRKKLEVEENIHKDRLKAYAHGNYLDFLATNGYQPPTPLKVINDEHETVTYVITDRGHLTTIDDGVYGDLVDLIGQEKTDEIVYQGGQFSFDPVILSQDSPDGKTIQDHVAEAIGEALQKLVDDGKLSEDQMGGLLCYEETRRYKPGLVQKVVDVVGKSPKKLKSFFDVVGSAVTRYVKCS